MRAFARLSSVKVKVIVKVGEYCPCNLKGKVKVRRKMVKGKDILPFMVNFTVCSLNWCL